jgi:hypothetical protein
MQPMILTPAQESAPVFCSRINVRQNGALFTVDFYMDQFDTEGSSRHFHTREEALNFAQMATRWVRPEAYTPEEYAAADGQCAFHANGGEGRCNSCER